MGNAHQTNIPIILLGCEQDGAAGAFSPIAWQHYLSGHNGPSVRFKNLSSGTYREAWFWLPPRTRASGGRLVVSTLGTEGVAGTLFPPDFAVYRTQLPAMTVSSGLFNSATAQQEVASVLVSNGAHVMPGWTAANILTNIDLTLQWTAQPLLAFSNLVLRVRAPYGTAGGSYGMYLNGLAVSGW